jgi:hypothetical protein
MQIAIFWEGSWIICDSGTDHGLFVSKSEVNEEIHYLSHVEKQIIPYRSRFWMSF